jgi:hypothetical protein
MTNVLAWATSMLAWVAAGMAGYGFDFSYKLPGSFWSYSNLMTIGVTITAALNGLSAKVLARSASSLFFVFGFLSVLFFWNIMQVVIDGPGDAITFGFATVRSLIVSCALSSVLMSNFNGRKIFLQSSVIVTCFCAILGIAQVVNAECTKQGICALVIPHLIFWHMPFGFQLYRASGALLDPNVYAAFLVMGFAAGLILIDKKFTKKNIFLAFAMFLQLTAIFLSGSRGGVLAVSGVLFFRICYMAIKGKNLFLAIFSTAIGTLPLSLFFITGARSLVDNSTSERLAILYRSAEYLEKFPSLFGNGFLHFNRVDLEHDVASGLVAHNTFLELLQHSGLLGSIIFIYMGWAIIVRRKLDEFIVGSLLSGLFLSLQSNLIFGLGFSYIFIVSHGPLPDFGPCFDDQKLNLRRF